MGGKADPGKEVAGIEAKWGYAGRLRVPDSIREEMGNPNIGMGIGQQEGHRLKSRVGSLQIAPSHSSYIIVLNRA